MICKKVYFAHPVTEYDTFDERERIAFLQLLFAEIVNPNRPTHSASYKTQGWPYFGTLVQTCDSVVFSSFPNGAIGAGVAKEVQHFLDTGKPAFRCYGLRSIAKIDRIDPTLVLDVPTTRKLISYYRKQRS